MFPLPSTKAATLMKFEKHTKNHFYIRKYISMTFFPSSSYICFDPREV